MAQQMTTCYSRVVAFEITCWLWHRPRPDETYNKLWQNVTARTDCGLANTLGFVLCCQPACGAAKLASACHTAMPSPCITEGNMHLWLLWFQTRMCMTLAIYMPSSQSACILSDPLEFTCGTVTSRHVSLSDSSSLYEVYTESDTNDQSCHQILPFMPFTPFFKKKRRLCQDTVGALCARWSLMTAGKLAWHKNVPR